jgi:hypothetical protein
MDYGYDHPDYWSSKLQSEPNCFLSPDLCVIEKRDFFVRGLIEVPIITGEEPFRWGVWVSLSEKNFNKMVELWNDAKLLEQPSYFGWLSNSIDLYPETLNLKTQIRSRDIKLRPFITLENNDHPLALEQRNGITLQRVREIAEHSLHGE